MNKIIISAVLILIYNTVLGQSFKGEVLDFNKKQPIPYVQIYFPELKTGTTTDKNGLFEILNINQKKIRIQIAYTGYDIIDEIINIEEVKNKIFYLQKGHFDLKEIIISVPNSRLQGESIVNIEHSKIMKLQENSPSTLAEAISNIPGVDQNTTGVGIGKPVIRGLSGNRIVVYSQGIRVENQQWGSEHGLGVGEVGIESVEVIKGPASMLYGSDALGGVIYFIDERYAKQNKIEAFVETKFMSNTLSSIHNIGVKLNKKGLKLNVFGSYSSHGDYTVPNGDKVFNTRFDESNFKTSIGFSTENWIYNIRYSYLKNNFGIVEDAIYSDSNNRDFILPLQTIQNHSLSFENNIFIGDSKINMTLGYSNNFREEFEDDINERALGLKLSTYTYDIKWNSPLYSDVFSFIVGSQAMSQENRNNGEEILIPNAKTTDIGLFTLANINWGKLQFQTGLRLDYRTIKTEKSVSEETIIPSLEKSYNSINFSVGGVYKADKYKIRANISSGFRAPNTSELLSDGVHEGTNRYEIGNSNLVNENALQFDLSYEYKYEHFDFSVNTFYNTIYNYIYISPTTEFVEGNSVFEYLQTDARLYGGELYLHYHPHSIHWLHIDSDISTVIAQDNNGNSLPLIPQTKINTSVSAEISRGGKFNVKNMFIQNIYKLGQSNIGVNETRASAYSLINIGVNMEINTKYNPILVNTGIKNIFNTTYIDHLSRFKDMGIPNVGINFYIGLKINLKS
ncbi:MAG: TonB-dependent receptor [Flavobacteriaceae bacterium]|nr:TonB-dependent receptor [Flavobacteriaceae bacterium]